MDDLLTTEQVAAMVHLNPATIRWHRHRGTGPRGFRVPTGKRVLYKRSDVEEWLERGYAEAVAAETASA